MIRSENKLKSACASVFAERCIRTTVVYYEFSSTEYKRIKGVVGWLVTVLGRMKEREALFLTWTKEEVHIILLNFRLPSERSCL